MITGEVTADSEAVVTVRIYNANGQEAQITAVIDTGFTDYLTLPPEVVDALGLPFVNTIRLYLAGNVEAVFDMHTVTVDWDGVKREMLAYKADGAPLIGMALLRGFRLTVDGLDGGPVTIARLEA
jgi:clan AA aspartic protease